MTQYESPVKHIPYAQQRVYNKLSDLNNLESLKGRVPEDKVDNLSYDADHVSFNVTGVGISDLRCWNALHLNVLNSNR
jgi:hypothetical protein